MESGRLFELDRGRCIACGLCVKECAFKALRRGDDGRPDLPDEAKCMRCQHCLAVCPKGAIVFDGCRPEDSVPLAGLELPTAAAAENWLRTRRSIRHFCQEDVDRALLTRILQTLGNTPTGCNARGLTFTCYPDRVSMDAFRQRFLTAVAAHRDGTKVLPRWLAAPAIRMRRGGEDLFFRGAPGMLIISSDERNPEVTTPNEDVAAAICAFELLANAHGLGTCWCGFLRLVQSAVPELLEATSGIRRTTPFYAMLFGLPAVRYARGVQRDGYAKIVWQ